MLRAALAVSAALVVCATAASATSDDLCPDFPPVTLRNRIRVPDNKNLDGERLWQFTVCKPANYSGCPNAPDAYVTEINADGEGCGASFSASEYNGHWLQKYGGIHSTFLGTAQTYGDRIANVTLICDLNATTPTPDGDVIARIQGPASATWITYDIRVRAASICKKPPPPGPQCPDLPLITLPIEQVVRANASLSGLRLWQLSVCKPAGYSGCPSTSDSYVTEINADGEGCDVGFNTDTGFGFWEPKYGGMHNAFSGTVKTFGDRIANVTLICDRNATTPTSDGPVVTHLVGDAAWAYDIRLRAASVCP